MDSKNYQAIQTCDGSFTLYNQSYKQHYHSTKDGALNESISKHVKPAFEYFSDQKSLVILDICFGLGINTLATLWFNEHYGHDKNITIYTPELDSEMLNRLESFTYPEALLPYKTILSALLNQGYYQDARYHLELYRGDARAYIQRFSNRFDIVYQDAFSPQENPLLWTVEYFRDIKKAVKAKALITSYSIALKSRLALYENGFLVYIQKGNKIRSATVATTEPTTLFEPIDMPHKIACNPEVKPLSDTTV